MMKFALAFLLFFSSLACCSCIDAIEERTAQHRLQNGPAEWAVLERQLLAENVPPPGVFPEVL